LATAYVKDGKTLVSIASWAKEDVNCRLRIDWKFLRINPKQAKLPAPAIEDFQNPASFVPGDVIPVEAGKGWLLIIEEK